MVLGDIDLRANLQASEPVQLGRSLSHDQSLDELLGVDSCYLRFPRVQEASLEHNS